MENYKEINARGEKIVNDTAIVTFGYNYLLDKGDLSLRALFPLIKEKLNEGKTKLKWVTIKGIKPTRRYIDVKKLFEGVNIKKDENTLVFWKVVNTKESSNNLGGKGDLILLHASGIPYTFNTYYSHRVSDPTTLKDFFNLTEFKFINSNYISIPEEIDIIAIEM